MNLPPLTLKMTDRDRLASTAVTALLNAHALPAATILLRELARAKVVTDDSLPRGVVAMYSQVEIKDHEADRVIRLRPVYPGEEVDDLESVSVLTPLGTALIGLSEGDSIEWSTATGDRSGITVLRVLT